MIFIIILVLILILISEFLSFFGIFYVFITHYQVFVFFMTILVGIKEPSMLFNNFGFKSLPFILRIVFCWEWPEHFLHLPEQQWVSEANAIHSDDCQIDEV